MLVLSDSLEKVRRSSDGPSSTRDLPGLARLPRPAQRPFGFSQGRFVINVHPEAIADIQCERFAPGGQLTHPAGE
jgi:hypothetical protein